MKKYNHLKDCPKILIVDDKPENLRSLSEILENKGFNVIQAAGMELTLKYLDTYQPDIILIEVHMLNMDGYEVCKKLRKNPTTRDIPVVFLGTFEKSTDRVQAFKTGGVDFISKPFDTEELFIRINNHLSNKKLRLDLEEKVLEKTREIEKYKKAIKSLDIMIIVVDRDYKFRLTNDAFLDTWGEKREDVLGKSVNEIFGNGNFKKIESNLEKCFNGEPVLFDMFIDHPDIGGKTLEISFQPTAINGNYIDHVVGMLRDISEHILFEEKVQWEKDRMKEAQEIGHLGNWEWDIKNDKMTWSDEVYRILGYKPQEIVSSYDNFINLIVHPDDKEYVQAQSDTKNEIPHKEFDDYEFRIIRKDGEIRHIQILRSPFFDKENNLVRMAGIIQDITKRKLIEERIQFLNQFHMLITKISTDLIKTPVEKIDDTINQALNHVGDFLDARRICINLYSENKRSFNRLYKWAQSDVAPLQSESLNIPVDDIDWIKDEALKGEPLFITQIDEPSNKYRFQRSAMEKIGAQSLIGFPLIGKNVVIGFSLIYLSNPYTINIKKLSQLLNVASQIFINALERKEVESNLNKVKNNLEDAQKIAHLGSWVWELTTNVVTWTDETYRIFGFKPNEVVPTYEFFLKKVHPYDKEFVKNSIDETVNQGKPLNIEHRVILPDGRIRYVHVIGDLFQNEGSKPNYMIGTIHDITERRLVEIELEKHRNNLANLVYERTEKLITSERSALLLKDIASAANEAENTKEVFRQVLKKITEYTHWPIGHVYVPMGDSSDALESTDIWHLKHPRKYSAFKKATMKTVFTPGIGLAGRVLQSKKPEWIKNIFEDDNFTRSIQAKDIEMRSAYIAPVLVKNEVVAILEFFTANFVESDKSVFGLMDQISVQIGIAIERNMIEDALIESEHNHRTILNDLPVMVMRWKNDGTITFANNARKKNVRDPIEDIVGLNLYKRISAQNRKLLKERISKISPKSPVVSGEYNFIMLNGEERWEEWVDRGIFDWNGNLIEIQSVGRDITGIIKASEEQRKLSSAVQHNPAAVVITDYDGNIEYVNPRFEEITGFTVKETIGENPSMLKSGLLKDQYYDEMWKTIKSGHVWYGEFINKRKNGDLYFESASIAPIKNEAGFITHFVAIKEDITKQREAQNALQESEARLNSILDYAPIEVYMNDLDGCYLYINEKYKKVEGLTGEEVVGKTDHELFPPDVAKLYSSRLNEVVETQKVQFFDTKIGEGDDARYFKAIILPLINKKGEIYATCGWNWDITDQIIVEAAMEKARIAAEDANLAKSKFVASMSHEIRTPLNAISGMVYLLDNTSLEESQKNMLVNINSASDALLNIINDILDFSKIEAGKLDIENIEFRLRNEIDKFASIVGFKAQTKGLDFNISIDPDIPNQLIGDPTRLIQVLTNLAGNAVKFTNKGEIFLEIEILKQKGSEILLQFSVQDTGIGIPTNVQKNIFKPFVQAELSTTRQYGGTGLGLSISKLLVEKMDGTITLKSKKGKGSTFIFQIPFIISKKYEKKHIAPGKLINTRVCLVENSTHALKSMTNLIKSFNLAVNGYSSYSKIYDAIKEKQFRNNFDLIIFDLSQVSKIGLPLIRKIIDNKLFDRKKIIALINFGEEETLQNLKQLGIARTVLKPLTHSTIYNAILLTLDIEKTQEQDIEKQKIPSEVLMKLTGSKILIVEDNHINQLVTSQLLTMVEIKSDIAQNGKEAIRMVEENNYDAVLMDLQMPVMNGIEATRSIRSNPKHKELPIIALTADVVKEVKEKIYASGMNDYLAKPIDVDEFYAKLLLWIGQKEKK